MPFYDPSTYGEEIAHVYDSIVDPMTGADEAVEFLAAVAGRRRVLELGIGTGRVAIPLAARGFPVCGIDASEKMIARLRAKDGGAAIPVEIGNFADVKIGGKFSLVYVVFNTFFALASQDEQIRCFARVARHLTDDGIFVIEAFVPDHTFFDRNQRVSVSRLETDLVKLDVSIHDRATQSTRAAHILIGADGVRLFPIQIRYAYPAELDLMARIAGMRLRERWGGWKREPFIAGSNLHVSVYELIPPQPSPPPRLVRRKPAARPVRRRGA